MCEQGKGLEFGEREEGGGSRMNSFVRETIHRYQTSKKTEGTYLRSQSQLQNKRRQRARGLIPQTKEKPVELEGREQQSKLRSAL